MPPLEHEAHGPPAHPPSRPHRGRPSKCQSLPPPHGAPGPHVPCQYMSRPPRPNPAGHSTGLGAPLTCPGVRARTGLTAVAHTVPS